MHLRRWTYAGIAPLNMWKNIQEMVGNDIMLCGGCHLNIGKALMNHLSWSENRLRYQKNTYDVSLKFLNHFPYSIAISWRIPYFPTTPSLWVWWEHGIWARPFSNGRSHLLFTAGLPGSPCSSRYFTNAASACEAQGSTQVSRHRSKPFSYIQWQKQNLKD